MFAEKSDQFVTDLVNGEYYNARRLYGDTYEDHDEASRVLAEELHEVRSEMIMLEQTFRNWEEMSVTERALDMVRYARNGIKELAQVAAVAMKIIDTDRPKEKENGRNKN